MSDQSQMSDPVISGDTPSVTSSPASEDGHERSDSPDGLMIDLFGQEVVPASLGPLPTSSPERVMKTSEIYGRISVGSYASQGLTSFLANRLQTRFVGDGLTEHSWTLRLLHTPAGRRYFQFYLLAQTTNDSESSSWPSPAARDGRDLNQESKPFPSQLARKSPSMVIRLLEQGVPWTAISQVYCLSMGFPLEWNEARSGATATPSFPKLQQSLSAPFLQQRSAHEEHALVRRFLQKLRSNYQYTSNLISGEYVHQPVKIVITKTAGAGSTSTAVNQPKAPTFAPVNASTSRPSALAFALQGATSGPDPAPERRPEPAPTPVTAEVERPATVEVDRPTIPDPVSTIKPARLAEATPAEVLRNSLESRGHRVLTRDGRLFISNARLLTDEDEVAIQAHKPELIAIAEYWPEPRKTSLAIFLGTAPPPSAKTEWVAQPPPENLPTDIIINFETNGLNWAGGDEPVGVTVGTHDGFKRYLPFAHRGGGNLDREVVIRFLKSLRNKRIKNANTRFDVHMGRNIDVDFEAQGCTVSDIMHTAALLDDHRRRFALDVLAKDYLGGVEVERIDERNMADYSASEVAQRAEYQAELVARLHAVMWPQIVEQDLEKVHRIEDDVIYPVVEMEKNGSQLDVELLEKFYADCTKRHDDLMWEISQEVGFGFEHSASGWKRLLEHYHLPIPNSFAENVLTAYDHPMVRKGQRAAQYASLNSKTFTAYKNNIDSNGVLRYDINQLRGDDGGTVSGRFSIGYVQQVPNHDNHHAAFGEGDVDACKGVCDLFPRRLFIAGEGADYLETDAMQIEYRLFAHFAQNEEVLKAYREDPLLSFHKKMWAMVKQYKPDMLYSHQKNYDFAKQYGAKIIKLATMLGFITEREAEEIRNRKAWNDPRLTLIKEIDTAFSKAMPEVDQLLDKASHLAKSKCDNYCRRGDWLHKQFPHRGYVKTIAGRRSRFPDNYKTYIGLNRVLQGSGADIMKVKLAELHRERKFTQFLMRLTVHDAVGGDAQTPETGGRVAEILNTQSFPELRVPILWSMGTGRSWADCK